MNNDNNNQGLDRDSNLHNDEAASDNGSGLNTEQHRSGGGRADKGTNTGGTVANAMGDRGGTKMGVTGSDYDGQVNRG